MGKFLTPDECDHIIGLATSSNEFQHSSQQYADSMLYRTAFLHCEADQILGAVQRRIATLVCLPLDAHQETMVSQYTALAEPPGESVTNLHHDHNGNPQRTCTVLVYLNKFDTGIGGGGTFFPCANLQSNDGGPCPMRVLGDC